jgi:hypothetical protein
MFRSSFGFVSHNTQIDTGESGLRWLRGTHELDTMHPHITSTVDRLSYGRRTLKDKALAIHDVVKRMPFACEPDYAALTASKVLKLARGDCFTKGMLFVTLLRAAGIPARLRFVSLPVHFLRGIVEMPDPSIMHAMAEVYLDETWWVTDTYVPDVQLVHAATAKLAQEGQAMGYGIHVQGVVHWDGASHASAQCSTDDASSLPVVDWGISDDPESFYADESHSELRRNFVTRLKWRLAAPIVNNKVEALRATVKPA